ncbi:copper resistance D domain-containing protein [Pandoraea terrae]|uniref:Copper resistance D domain-containing protein n=1 Tax=Pandoraea terrae TaxID=1537710 RepID=A0A5E4V6X8_9BURK|nr:CopD family protein [Pandoraea terrae]VVE07613.1 copper resistance D domain-containing protein [Pandoraea terrae]
MAPDLAALTWQPSAAGLLDLALALAAGVLVLRHPHAVRPGLTVRTLPLFAAGLAALSLLAYLAAGTVAMTGGDEDGAGAFLADVWAVLTQSHFGAMQWLAATGVMLIACGAWLWRQARKKLALTAFSADDPRDRHHQREHQAERLARGIFGAGVVALAVARAATGHAADAGFVSAAVLIHTFHVLAAATWTGTLLVAGCALPGWRRWPVGARAAYGERLSSIATLALLVVLCSGLFNAWRTIGGTPVASSNPGAAPYLVWLGAKLVLVVFAISLGAWNRWRFLPRLAGDDHAAQRAFARIVAMEALVLVMVITFAAKLGTTMPPA